MIERALGRLGGGTEEALAGIGRVWGLARTATAQGIVGPLRGEKVRWREAIAQVSRAGEQSLPLVVLIALLVGMILALQSADQLRQLGAVRLVADLVAVSMVRELAPLVTAILVAGRVGSAIAAELGTMRVSEEVDALTVMGIDPVAFLVVPRLVGLVVAVPCLTFFADLAGMLGGAAVAGGVLGLGFSGYWADSMAALGLDDVWSGAVKAVGFGALVALIACERGLGTRGGAEEVGRSTTAAVVWSIVAIIVADLAFTAWFYARGS